MLDASGFDVDGNSKFDKAEFEAGFRSKDAGTQAEQMDKAGISWSGSNEHEHEDHEGHEGHEDHKSLELAQWDD